LAVKDSLVEFNQQVKVYSSVRNKSGAVTFNWYINDSLTLSTPDSTFAWTVPATEGQYKLLLNITDGTSSVKDSLQFTVVSDILTPPVITMDSLWYSTGSTASLVCHATSSPDKASLKYYWNISGGSIIFKRDSVLNWEVPLNEGLYAVTCIIKNPDSLSAMSGKQVLVKKRTQLVGNPIAYFPMDGDVKDYSGNEHNASSAGVQLTADARGEPNKAYKFSDPGNIIDVPNVPVLNFQDQITLSFWLKLDAVPAESYVLSHGSYQDRWKISVIPNHKLRWTVKTTSATVDLDSSSPLQLNQFYHFTVIYTGYSMELYIDGELDAYVSVTGQMNMTSKDITFGRETASIENYSLYGTLDEVRIYDHALGPNEIATLKTLWNSITAVENHSDQKIRVYPNPSSGELCVEGIDQPVVNVLLTDVTGRSVSATYFVNDSGILQLNYQSAMGILFLKIETTTEVVYWKILN